LNPGPLVTYSGPQTTRSAGRPIDERRFIIIIISLLMSPLLGHRLSLVSASLLSFCTDHGTIEFFIAYIYHKQINRNVTDFSCKKVDERTLTKEFCEADLDGYAVNT
jgi:hypothetical protein